MILNALIPDVWVLRAMASILSEGAHTYKPGPVFVKNKQSPDDRYTIAELAARPLRTIHNGQYVWIVPTNASARHGMNLIGDAGRRTTNMMAALDVHGIEYWRANVALKESNPDSWADERLHYQWGVIVRLQNACDAIQAIWPTYLDRCRAARYDNDDH